MEKEIRYYDFSDRREFAPRIVDDSREVEGYAIVFDQPSRVLYDAETRKLFTEIVKPEAVSVDFLNEQDIKLLYNHDKNQLLARSVAGAGTLSFDVDEYGVKYRAELPNTTVGNDVLELVRRGDLFGCSFAFQYASDGVKDARVNGQNVRTITAFASVSDFSIVVDPAYLGTMVSTRDFEAVEEPAAQAEPEVAPFSEASAKELAAILRRNPNF